MLMTARPLKVLELRRPFFKTQRDRAVVNVNQHCTEMNKIYLESLISFNEIKIIVTYVYGIIVIDKLPLGQLY